MAYMSQEKKKALAPKVKAVLNKYNMSGSLSVRHHSVLILTLSKGPLFSSEASGKAVNVYWIKEHYTGIERDFLLEVVSEMNDGNHDRSDIQSDYFDVGWYIEVHIGKWNKPYTCIRLA